MTLCPGVSAELC